ncbi:hypothetical protein [Microvirga arabica]|uniref:hypothetical protein n=1 Tax=Microvirga arabica TaxID=1128671 RepID=UPI001939F539|nr:hypothetical protein [Microvirga arabica]MBM1174479.1 hypothetical protein [Microvirga arabica]
MTEEEIEVVAQELAKVGGVAWYPGRTSGSLLRPLTERYRDRARVAIAALERVRARQSSPPAAGEKHIEAPAGRTDLDNSDSLHVGATVIYRPAGDKRAVSCRIEKLEDGRAYLVPVPQPDIGWVSLDTFSVSSNDTKVA